MGTTIEDAQSAFSEAENWEESGNFWEVGNACEKALKILAKVKKTPESDKLRRILKEKLRNSNIEIQKTFKKHQFKAEIPEEKMREFIDTFVKDGDEDLEPTFQRIVEHLPLFCPNFDEVEKNSQKHFPVSMHFCSGKVVSDEGDIVRKSQNSEWHWFCQNYMWQQDFVLKVYIYNIFHELETKELFDAKNFKGVFHAQGFLHQDFQEIFGRAIDRFFEKDYISAIHILVPQFERIFLALTKAINTEIDDIASREEKGGRGEFYTQKRTLSEPFLSSPEVQSVWGKNFCEQIKFVFFEPLGYRLRHKIAHGEMSASECNFTSCSLVLYFYIIVVMGVHPEQ